MYVTYQDLVQIGIFIVALVGLLYHIRRGKKYAATSRTCDG